MSFCGYLGCMVKGYCKEHEGLRCPSCNSRKSPRKLPYGGAACSDCVRCHVCGGKYSIWGNSTWFKDCYFYCDECVSWEENSALLRGVNT